MSEITINDKYRVVNTLFSDPNQSVYYVNNSLSETKCDLIMNEIKDKKIVSQLIDVFLDNNEALKSNFVEFFFKESKFYVVSRISPGETLGNIILKTILSEAEKIDIAGSFLQELTKLEELPLSIQQVLCNFGNISVAGNKDVYFNHFLSFTKEDFLVKKEDIIAKAGDILTAIYMNSLYFRREDINKLPEEVVRIINRCMNREYTSISQICEEFKNNVRLPEEEQAAFGLEHLFQRNRVFLSRKEKNDRNKRKQKKIRLYLEIAGVIVVMTLLGVILSTKL